MNRFKFVKFKDLLSIFWLIIAFIPAIIAKIFIRDFWLVCEDKNEARDNGYWFFRYLRLNQPKQKCAYAINKKSVDYNKVKSLGKVIQYGSLSHWFWYIVADKNISSQKGGKPNAAVCYLLEVCLKMRKNNRVFLQHGVTKADAKWLYFKNTNMRLFCTATQQEQDFISSTFGYPEDNVKLTGFCRFDNLNNFKVDKKQILLMPTWRQWIAKGVETKDIEGTDVFTETKYYKKWNEFLSSKKLDEMLKKYDVKLLFYPHRNMQKYLNQFKINSENIITGDWENYDIQQVLKDSALMITDYSSVCFDFAYMKKPIIFYQFDEQDFLKYQYDQGYFDHHNNPVGDWTGTLDDTLNKMEEYLKSDYKHNHLKELETYFKYNDNKNCERTYLAIKNLNK
ncbi:MAG: CDP-glycerol glycerophosphotransferase family protein [Clostridia bacterium]|nr:CDP-glycerol glycerophosphotransferase family protein [Clostridia bacterium]